MPTRPKSPRGLSEEQRPFEPQTAKLFWNGRSQAVRLPKECRFEGEEVLVRRDGNSVVLSPVTAGDDPWKDLFAAFAMYDPRFPIERHQPPVQVRKSLEAWASPKPARRRRSKA